MKVSSFCFTEFLGKLWDLENELPEELFGSGLGSSTNSKQASSQPHQPNLIGNQVSRVQTPLQNGAVDSSSTMDGNVPQNVNQRHHQLSQLLQSKQPGGGIGPSLTSHSLQNANSTANSNSPLHNSMSNNTVTANSSTGASPSPASASISNLNNPSVKSPHSNSASTNSNLVNAPSSSPSMNMPAGTAAVTSAPGSLQHGITSGSTDTLVSSIVNSCGLSSTVSSGPVSTTMSLGGRPPSASNTSPANIMMTNVSTAANMQQFGIRPQMSPGSQHQSLTSTMMNGPHVRGQLNNSNPGVASSLQLGGVNRTVTPNIAVTMAQGGNILKNSVGPQSPVHQNMGQLSHNSGIVASQNVAAGLQVSRSVCVSY